MHADGARLDKVRELLDSMPASGLNGHAAEFPPTDVYAEDPAADPGRYQRGAIEPPKAPAAEPIEIAPASTWAAKPAPAPRDWIIEGLIPAGRVTSIMGDGGIGKSTLLKQMAVHVATSSELFGRRIYGGVVVGIFCEDEPDEVERRIRAVAGAESIELERLTELYAYSREGQDNLLCTFENEQVRPTEFYHVLDATLARYRPRLLQLDTAADLFGGNFLSTPHVRQFIKVVLGGLCVRHGCAIVLAAHPSAAGLADGSGGGFSTAWNNSVRSRMYLRRPKGDSDEGSIRRVLELKKANYAPDGLRLPLLLEGGRFAIDPDPIEESQAVARARPRANTRMAMAVLDALRLRATKRLARSCSAA